MSVAHKLGRIDWLPGADELCVLSQLLWCAVRIISIDTLDCNCLSLADGRLGVKVTLA